MKHEGAQSVGAAGIPQNGEIVGDKYRIERRLGQGGMGAVFEACHLVTGKRVALKWLLAHRSQRADDFERLIREARAAALTHHDGVVDIYDVGEHNGALFLVMEYLQGQTLRVWMDAGALQPGPLIGVLLPALRGVHAAHQRGVIHRDLKPENLFVCSDGEGEPLRAKVLDFGISKLAQSAREGALTESGTVLGTPHYMAPEQAEDSNDLDHRADIYALGVVLYEALAGTRPYHATTLTALLLQIARSERKPLCELRPDLPRDLTRAVERAMARDPGARFARVSELIAAIEPHAHSLVLALPDVGERHVCAPETGAQRRVRARRARWSLIMIAAVASMFAVFAWTRSQQQGARIVHAPSSGSALAPNHSPAVTALTAVPAADLPPPNDAPNESQAAAAPAQPATRAPSDAVSPKPRRSTPRAAASIRAPSPGAQPAAAPLERHPRGRLGTSMRQEQF